jgi:hypothetical protein
MDIQVTMEMLDSQAPTKPQAKRGAVAERPIDETPEQRQQGRR